MQPTTQWINKQCCQVQFYLLVHAMNGNQCLITGVCRKMDWDRQMTRDSTQFYGKNSAVMLALTDLVTLVCSLTGHLRGGGHSGPRDGSLSESRARVCQRSCQQ